MEVKDPGLQGWSRGSEQIRLILYAELLLRNNSICSLSLSSLFNWFNEGVVQPP